jgi:predicted phosphodiesterase
MRLGVLSDLHHEPAPTGRRRWINPYDPTGLLPRIAEALEWFAAAHVDRVVVTGDLVEAPSSTAYDDVLSACTQPGFPVAVVGGNHDWSPEHLLREKAHEHGCALLRAATGDELAAVEAEPAAALFASTAVPTSGNVVVSHFPVLSEVERLTAAGLPYPGDLDDRADVARHLQSLGRPLIVLSGHIHARCTRADGNILQLGAAAMIEPPHDAAVVTVSSDATVVTRECRRFGPVAAVDPVLADDVEQWRWDGGWRRRGKFG